MNYDDIILKHLLALGDTEEKVVATLTQLGIRGLLTDPCHCPIAAAGW